MRKPNDSLQLVDNFFAQLIRPAANDVLELKGKFKLELLRGGEVIEQREWENTVANEGKNYGLDIVFNATTQPSWFMGIFDSGGGSTVSVSDTMSSHSGWAEFTGYASGTRPAWGSGASVSQSITNGTPVSYAINSSGTIVGGFITSSSTKGGTSGKLWSAGVFTGIAVINGDTLRLTYTLTVA